MKVWEFDPNIASVKDWRNKYGGCIVRVSLTDRPGYRYHRVDTSEERTVIGDFGFLSHDVPEELVGILQIEPWIPDSQWIMTEGGIPAFLRRLPAKQWHRSFCSGMYSVSAPYLPQHSLKQARRIFERVESAIGCVVKVKHLTLDEAIKELPYGGKHPGRVLSKMYALIVNDEGVYSIYSSMGLIGFVNAEHRTITVTEHLYQEVIDFLKGDNSWHVRPTSSL